MEYPGMKIEWGRVEWTDDTISDLKPAISVRLRCDKEKFAAGTQVVLPSNGWEGEIVTGGDTKDDLETQQNLPGATDDYDDEPSTNAAKRAKRNRKTRNRTHEEEDDDDYDDEPSTSKAAKKAKKKDASHVKANPKDGTKISAAALKKKNVEAHRQADRRNILQLMQGRESSEDLSSIRSPSPPPSPESFLDPDSPSVSPPASPCSTPLLAEIREMRAEMREMATKLDALARTVETMKENIQQPEQQNPPQQPLLPPNAQQLQPNAIEQPRQRFENVNATFPPRIQFLCENRNNFEGSIRELTSFMFTDEELSTSTLSGKGKLKKRGQLDPYKVGNIVQYIQHLYPGRKQSEVRNVIGVKGREVERKTKNH